jgi:hypothetical protein
VCIGVHAYWYLWLWYSSPAAEVGVIKVGDELVAVDGESIKGMGFVVEKWSILAATPRMLLRH